MDRHGPGFPGHFLARSRQLVQWLPLVFQCGIHRWNLLDFAEEFIQHSIDLRIIQVRNFHFPAGLTFDIARGGRFTQESCGDVGFRSIQHKPGCFAGLAETDGKHAGGKGVQAAGMPGLAGLEQPTNF